MPTNSSGCAYPLSEICERLRVLQTRLEWQIRLHWKVKKLIAHLRGTA